MRMIIGLGGLVALLVVVFIMLSLSAENASVVVPAGQKAHKQAERIAGRDVNGRPVSESITLEPYGSGKTTSLVVQDIEPNGPMATYFGLQKGDKIVQVGPLAVEDGAEVAKSEMTNAYRQHWSLVVLRGDERLKLPEPTAPSNQSNPQAQPQTPQAGAPSPSNRTSPRGSIYDQINSIKRGQIPTH